MKDIKGEIAKVISLSSQNLAQFVAGSAFEFWQRKDFRLYVNFENIPRTEQDRIFNELELSIIGLFILKFDHTLSTAKDEQKVVISALKKDLAPAFMQILADAGVEQKFIDQWDYLIDMRLKEYQKDLKIALKESSSWEELKGDEDMRIAWARIETITIDCLSHVRRGDVKEGDPLWKLLRKWFITMDATLNPITQG